MGDDVAMSNTHVSIRSTPTALPTMVSNGLECPHEFVLAHICKNVWAGVDFHQPGSLPRFRAAGATVRLQPYRHRHRSVHDVDVNQTPLVSTYTHAHTRGSRRTEAHTHAHARTHTHTHARTHTNGSTHTRADGRTHGSTRIQTDHFPSVINCRSVVTTGASSCTPDSSPSLADKSLQRQNRSSWILHS